MVTRKIVKIDEDLCNGCGECIPNCAEGALQIVDGKAKIVKDMYCDGLGACLGHCPQDAIEIIEREADPFDEEAVHEYLKEKETDISCVSCQAVLSLESTPQQEHTKQQSGLTQWPVQLNLVPLKAPFYDGKELLVMADCVPVAHPNTHAELLKGKSVVIGCPKFDNGQHYIDKLSEIIKRNDIRGIMVARMEVPCCSGLNVIAERALQQSGKNIPVKQTIITVRGTAK